MADVMIHRFLCNSLCMFSVAVAGETTIIAYEPLGVKVQHVAPSNRHSDSRTFSPKISDNISFSIVHTLRSALANSG